MRFLMERGYRKAYVESQIDKVRRMSRAEENAFCGNISSPIARHQ